jgi:hypothetical protein
MCRKKTLLMAIAEVPSALKAMPFAHSIKEKFITGQNEREETTQDAIVTKSAAFASYEINYLTYITATYTRAKRRWHGATVSEKFITGQNEREETTQDAIVTKSAAFASYEIN